MPSPDLTSPVQLPQDLGSQRMFEEPNKDLSCTVIVCTRDRSVQLEKCLEAVSRLRYPKFNVLVVDNAPQEARSQEVAMRWGARYCVEPNPGLSRARNRGARESDTEIVAYLDDDSLCEPEWLDALVSEFADSKVMVVTGKVSLVLPDGNVAYPKQDINERRVVDRETSAWFELANFGGLGNGGNMAFRRCVFDRWPGFDERLGRGALLWGGEEHYAFFSLINRGHRVVYTPEAVVSHPYPHTRDDLRTRHLKSYAALTGYLTLLLLEEPRFRHATIKYIFEGIKHVERAWRYSSGASRSPIPLSIPTWQKYLAYLSGPLLYVGSCLQRAFQGKS
jgi:O-antigen biosynthesis protein